MTQDISRTGGASDDTLTGGTASSGADADFLAMNPGSSDDDTLDGGAGDDTLYGGDGDDTVDGGAGNDRLEGGRGADRLTGGRGTDTLYGGSGHDIFAFAVGDGADDINDFEAGDLIEMAGVPGGFAGLVIEQEGANAVIRYGDGDTIKLEGVSAASLGADDFRFLPVEAAPPEGGGEDALAQGAPPDGDDDALSGGPAGGKVLTGGKGADTLTGGDGDDTLRGGKGDDTLTGGKGGVELTRFRGYRTLWLPGRRIHDATNPPTCRTRPSFATRWWSWPARDGRSESSHASSSARTRLSVTGSARPTSTRAAAATD